VTGSVPERRVEMIEYFDPLDLKREMLRILHPDGRCEEGLKPNLSDETVLHLYREISFLRAADQRALSLQRQGRFGTYAPFIGQEAAQVGSAFALEKEDWVFPSFREMAACYMRGVPLKHIFVYWMGNEMGQRFPDDTRVFPISIPVGTQMLHAVGVAWAAKLQGEKICTLAYFGDGGTSEGDFHEAMNFAGVFQTPTIFLCQNNHYAISVPRKTQTASETLAQKALAYGFRGIQVDGNDLFAVYAATKEAREQAVSGGGPTFIEAVTYRLGPHTTADDPTKYRNEEEVEAWKPLDPLLRLRKYLGGKGLWNEDMEEQIAQDAKERMDKLVEESESFPEPSPREMFEYTFAELTPNLKEQMEDYLAFLKEKGE
jgi:pyruvate dehydrogenase E1 component alpha subunit